MRAFENTVIKKTAVFGAALSHLQTATQGT